MHRNVFRNFSIKSRGARFVGMNFWNVFEERGPDGLLKSWGVPICECLLQVGDYGEYCSTDVPSSTWLLGRKLHDLSETCQRQSLWGRIEIILLVCLWLVWQCQALCCQLQTKPRADLSWRSSCDSGAPRETSWLSLQEGTQNYSADKPISRTKVCHLVHHWPHKISKRRNSGKTALDAGFLFQTTSGHIKTGFGLPLVKLMIFSSGPRTSKILNPFSSSTSCEQAHFPWFSWTTASLGRF